MLGVFSAFNELPSHQHFGRIATTRKLRLGEVG
jgi:hypothetical protein